MKKSSFVVLWLVIELFSRTVKGPSTQTKQNKKIIINHKRPLPPLAFLVWEAGPMLALSRSRLMEMSERPAVGSGNRDHRL